MYYNIFQNVIYSCNGKAITRLQCHMILPKLFQWTDLVHPLPLLINITVQNSFAACYFKH